MKARNTVTKSTADWEITAVRVFDAPRKLVWKAWTGALDQLAEYLARA